MISLNLLDFQSHLKIKKEGGKQFLFCPIRKKYLVLQPEELVRQLLLVYLTQEKKYAQSRISAERGLKVNELERRFDLLIYDTNTQPFILVECKAPAVKITQATFEQVANYNLSLRVPYLLTTNGISTFCCAMDYENESFEFLAEIPNPR